MTLASMFSMNRCGRDHQRHQPDRSLARYDTVVIGRSGFIVPLLISPRTSRSALTGQHAFAVKHEHSGTDDDEGYPATSKRQENHRI